MKLDEYDIVQVICDTASREYRISPNHDMRMQIRNFVMHVYIRQTWWEYFTIGTDPAGRNIYLSFSSDFRAYVGYSVTLEPDLRCVLYVHVGYSTPALTTSISTECSPCVRGL